MMDRSDAGRNRVFLFIASSRAGEACQTFPEGAGQLASWLTREASPGEPSRVVVPFGPGSIL